MCVLVCVHAFALEVLWPQEPLETPLQSATEWGVNTVVHFSNVKSCFLFGHEILCVT